MALANITNNILTDSGILVTNLTPTSRTLTINGVTYDLSADRSWTIAGGLSGSGTANQLTYWDGTSSVTGSATLTYSPTAQLLVNNSVTAASAIARGANFTPTLTAAANNDVLVGLDINPTFTNGAFTGVTNYAARFQNGNVLLSFNQNNGTNVIVSNTTSGVTSSARLLLTSDASSGQAIIGKYSTGLTTYKTLVGKDALIYNDATGGDISILNDFATGAIKMAAGGSSTAQLTLDANGNLTSSVNQNNTTLFLISNTNAGTSAQTQVNITSNSGSFQLGKYSSTRTAYKTITSSSAYIYNNTSSGNISILNDFATGNINFAAGGASTAQATLFSTGNFALNTSTDSGFRLDVNGTARVQNTLTISAGGASITGTTQFRTGTILQLFNSDNSALTNIQNIGASGISLMSISSRTTFNGGISATSGLANGVTISNTLTASANNDVLVGLDINPTFTNGAFTGVTNYILRGFGANGANVILGGGQSNSGTSTINIYGANVLNRSAFITATATGSFSNNVLNFGLNFFDGTTSFTDNYITLSSRTTTINFPFLINNPLIYPSSNNTTTSLSFGNGSQSVRGAAIFAIAGGSFGTTSRLDFAISSVINPSVTTSDVAMSLFNSKNFGIGTTTDAGFRLDVNGTARVQGNATISLNQNAATSLTVSNTTNGTTSQSQLLLNSGGQIFYIGKYSTSTNSYKFVNSGDSYISSSYGDIAILNDNLTGVIKFAAGGSSTAHLTIASTGAATFSGTLGINGVSDSIKSGTYTPTLTLVGNAIGSVAISVCLYTRVGNLVTVTGTISGTGSGTGIQQYSYELSLPITQTNTNLRGTATGSGQVIGGIGTNGLNGFQFNTNKMLLEFQSLNTFTGAGLFWNFTFTYEIA